MTEARSTRSPLSWESSSSRSTPFPLQPPSRSNNGVHLQGATDSIAAKTAMIPGQNFWGDDEHHGFFPPRPSEIQFPDGVPDTTTLDVNGPTQVRVLHETQLSRAQLGSIFDENPK